MITARTLHECQYHCSYHWFGDGALQITSTNSLSSRGALAGSSTAPVAASTAAEADSACTVGQCWSLQAHIPLRTWPIPCLCSSDIYSLKYTLFGSGSYIIDGCKSCDVLALSLHTAWSNLSQFFMLRCSTTSGPVVSRQQPCAWHCVWSRKILDQLPQHSKEVLQNLRGAQSRVRMKKCRANEHKPWSTAKARQKMRVF